MQDLMGIQVGPPARFLAATAAIAFGGLVASQQVAQGVRSMERKGCKNRRDSSGRLWLRKQNNEHS